MEDAKRLILPADGTTANFDSGSIFFIGTATVLLRYAGFTILTDPNFLHRGDHVHLGYGIHSERLTDPALDIEQLPPLDFVLLSHMHDDHFDRIAAEKLDKNLPIITTHHAAADLKQKGFHSPQALTTWETITVVKGDATLRITAMPGIHGPSILKALLPPVMGSMLEFQTPNAETKFRLYITGDTLIHQSLYEIPRRYPNIDLALLHLGGTKAFGILLTMDAKQGVQAIQIIAPRTAIPIHFNDYTVFKSALEDFKQAIAQAGLDNHLQYLNHGDTYTFTVS
ncbi:MBL fold metallo-hydrolase [Nodularia sp. LEGE 04288]|uniref:MBL fold metallo-hydrolase n=1 Tax=Nodularia sp. LEGE 04288 TaxID=1828639 RepID=UPI001D109311|nr:MBL fold metallo-hydrolase [Nodularia sp. LEGE 04288]MCC2693428.1 MBL fold metallo-hydrolase [Nodularia sp. LEGE 04288]